MTSLVPWIAAITSFALYLFVRREDRREGIRRLRRERRRFKKPGVQQQTRLVEAALQEIWAQRRERPRGPNRLPPCHIGAITLRR